MAPRDSLLFLGFHSGTLEDSSLSVYSLVFRHPFFVSFCYFLFQGSVWYLCLFNDTFINSVSKCVLVVVLPMFLQLSTYSSPVDVAVREVRQFNPLYIVYS